MLRQRRYLAKGGPGSQLRYEPGSCFVAGIICDEIYQARPGFKRLR